MEWNEPHYDFGHYELDHDKGPIDFYACDPPSLAELDQVLEQIIKKLVRYLQKKNIISQDEQSLQL